MLFYKGSSLCSVIVRHQVDYSNQYYISAPFVIQNIYIVMQRRHAAPTRRGKILMIIIVYDITSICYDIYIT